MPTMNQTKLRPYIAGSPPQLGNDRLYLSNELKKIQDALGAVAQAIQSVEAPWTQITPTPVFSTGAGTAKMRFSQLGKLVFITSEVICTTSGNFSSVPLPVQAQSAIPQQYLYGREIAVNGLGWSGIVQGTSLILLTTGGNSPAMTAGFNVIVSGVYESV